MPAWVAWVWVALKCGNPTSPPSIIYGARLLRLDAGPAANLDKMAEAMALIGLTSSIITFITFSSSLLSIAKSAYDAQGGVLPEIRELDLVIRDVTESQQKFTEAVPPNSDLMKCDGVTRDMAKECGKLAEDLRSIVSELTVKKDPRFPILESTMVALKRLSMSAQLKDVRTRLTTLDSRVRQNLVEALQKYDASQNQTSRLRAVANINHVVTATQSSCRDWRP